ARPRDARRPTPGPRAPGPAGRGPGGVRALRRLGDAGGPPLVASVATVTTLTGGFAALAVLPALGPLSAVAGRSRTAGPPS
ncbi:hypothetical protein ACFV5G_36845, partial [Streptomyces sp. NPDC059766]